MRWFIAALTSFAPTFLMALPIPLTTTSMHSTGADVEILEYNINKAYTKFGVAPGIKDQLTTSLVFELQINPSPDILSSNITLNNQDLDLKWTADTAVLSAVPQSQSIFVSDRFGFSHILQVSIFGELVYAKLDSPDLDNSAQSITLRVDSVDGFATGLSFTILTNPLATHRLLSLEPLRLSRPIDFTQYQDFFMITKESHITIDNEPLGYDEDDFDIEGEIESLLLLEAEAGELYTTIAAKRKAIAKCLKDHRDHVTLKHLLQQCDGVVCAAEVIAQRICDKMGILTEPKFGYAKMQDSQAQRLLADDGSVSEKAVNVSEKTAGSTAAAKPSKNASGVQSAAIKSIEVVYPQNVLFQVLGCIATALGLAALYAFIRRKFRSARSKVDRAADREERMNARAYRRAARRADMRRRWNAFLSAINCFRAMPERIEDYEEKRALILQDALLEQDRDLAEKGEVMEAEIRELRYAHEIVAGLVRDQNRSPTRDPPPPLVALPFTPTSARSRASTATLPSYTSEILPDYTSRYARTETASSSGSLRSNSVITDNFPMSSPLITSDDEAYTGNTSRSQSPEGSRSSRTSQTSRTSRTSRHTPSSSVAQVSPRASQETLQTGCRPSMDTARL